jgi:hypothetical protein
MLLAGHTLSTYYRRILVVANINSLPYTMR